MAVMHSMYRESGKVRIDPEACKQCGLCARICPAEVLVEDEGKVRVCEDNYFGCIACGHCMMICPEEAIRVTGRGVSPDDLMPLPGRKEMAGADALEALMRSRRSVRRFSSREVEAEILERIVEMAATGPMGIPPWDVGCVTVRGREEVQRLTGAVVKGYEGFLKIFRPWVLAVMRPFVGKAKYEMFADFIRPLAKSYVQEYREGKDIVFYESSALLIFHHSAYADHADAVIACTYAMLAAESLGLGSTMIGGATPIIQRNKGLCERLGVPAGNTPSIALILGYPATKFRKGIRRRFMSMSSVGG